MPKQYTFKTTRDTDWLEPVLDRLPAKERSRYIRMALCLLFDNARPAVTLGQTFVPPTVTPSETLVPEVRPVELLNYVVTERNGQTMVEKGNKATEWVKHDEPTFEALDEDLDSKLDNLFD